MYYWILINMADCLSSSIFSLWPKRNSSSKCTNYEFCVAIHTTWKLHTDYRNNNDVDNDTTKRNGTAHSGSQLGKKKIFVWYMCNGMAWWVVQWWNIMVASHDTASNATTLFDAYTHNRQFKTKYMHTNNVKWTGSCEPFGFGVGI